MSVYDKTSVFDNMGRTLQSTCKTALRTDHHICATYVMFSDSVKKHIIHGIHCESVSINTDWKTEDNIFVIHTLKISWCVDRTAGKGFLFVYVRIFGG